MEPNSPWLAVLAVATAAQSVVVVGIAVVAFRLYRSTTTAIERLERETLAPLLNQSQRAVERLEGVVDRIEHADDQIRDVITRTGERVAHVAGAVRNSLWPILGVSRGAAAAFSALTAPRPWPPRGRVSDARRVRPATEVRRATALEDESRFVYEGGIDHARS